MIPKRILSILLIALVFYSTINAQNVSSNYSISKEILNTVSKEDIHEKFEDWAFDSTNIVIATYCPDVENLPTESSILLQLKNKRSSTIMPYEDWHPTSDLLEEKKLHIGKVLKTKKGKFDSTIWTLGNGATIVLKPTQLKENQVRLTAISVGGTSLYKDDEFVNLELMSSLVSLGGLGDFDAIQLKKLLTGTTANVRSTVATLREGIVGYSSTNDIETMLQLAYLRFTAPRKDSIAYSSYIKRLKIQLDGKEKDPSTTFSDSLIVAMYGKHPRAKSIKTEDIQKIEKSGNLIQV
jgi:zinc protease